MSNQWPGGFVTKNPPVPSGPYADSTAQGLWTLSQQAGYRKQSLWPTQGNVNPDAFIENLFSTYLYTSTSGTDNQIVNGIDLSGKGGLVWIKSRTRASTNHYLVDTVRGSSLGVSNTINSNTTNAQATGANLDWVQFNNNGFTAKPVAGGGELGTNTYYGDMVGWTLREQPKFFEIVTYTGDGVQPRAIAHSLGSTPGCVIVKNIGTSGGWYVYHVGANAPGYTAAESYTLLNSTNAVSDNAFIWGNTAPSSTTFTVSTQLNASGNSYVAYLFADDAGGFGLSGNDNVISCGNYTCVTYPGDVTVTLGYEPQWVMVKNATQASNWVIYDNMRGMPATNPPNPVTLAPDSTAAENGVTGDAPGISPTATGFIARAGLTAVSGSPGDKIIYIAIRRGPMAVPTLGTKVFAPVVRTGTNTVASITGLGFAPDFAHIKFRTSAVNNVWYDRLRGQNRYLSSNNTNAQVSYSPSVTSYNNDGITFGDDLAQGVVNANGVSYVNYLFGRAPGFFDEVCYTGDGTSNRSVSHNLTTTPQLYIVKQRNGVGSWAVYNAFSGVTKVLRLETTDSVATDNWFGNVNPSASYFSVSADYNIVNNTFVAYLFATCAGVSKVGNYTGTGTTQAINCGFTAGARYVLIKRTDSTGDWYVWDSARGIVAGNDPYLLLNSDAAEVTSTDYIDTSAAGFEITSTAPAAINAVGGSYIFLAIS